MYVEEDLWIPFGEHETWVRRCVPMAPDPTKSPVIMLHGGPGAAHNYLLPFRELTRSGREVIFYDQLGCGNSTHLPGASPSFWTPQLFIAEFDNLTTALELDTFHIAGQSWGGTLAAEIAVRHPAGLQSVTILNSPASMDLWMKAAARLRAALPGDADERMRRYERESNTDDPEYLRLVDLFYRRHVCRLAPLPKDLADSFAQLNTDPTVYHTMNGPNEFHVIGTLRDWSIIGRLSQIDRPTLVLAGEHDEATPETWQPFLEEIPDVRGVIVADASHSSHLEQPETVFRIVEEFISGHEVNVA
ncbi:alpha/beta hydrolase [Microbacterium sp. Y-01]|uniref:proline iminopeptidase-family hydrolase n=1 Tax=Microbacterium sp. Y-01 TaxID=2048898 RepID=UPI000F5FF33D|nr:proline iminopeptidase-family hydrolase [Microbacterium sp. Y-01]AZH79037.1 alpha/beta hydrolase [Microbacterium sp. Y-01]